GLPDVDRQADLLRRAADRVGYNSRDRDLVLLQCAPDRAPLLSARTRIVVITRRERLHPRAAFDGRARDEFGKRELCARTFDAAVERRVGGAQDERALLRVG